MSKISVLVVDDSDLTRNIVLSQLRDLGISRVDEARDGSEALERMRTKNYGLILCDWEMPVMNGPELVNIIKREMRVQPNIVFMTSRSDWGSRTTAKQLGVVDYIAKPFTKATLQSRISRFMAA
jgi:two-component system chemotaxis response regulator CheY